MHTYPTASVSATILISPVLAPKPTISCTPFKLTPSPVASLITINLPTAKLYVDVFISTSAVGFILSANCKINTVSSPVVSDVTASPS